MSVHGPASKVKTAAPPASRRHKARRARSTGYCNPPTPAEPTYLAAPWGATALCTVVGLHDQRTTVTLRAPRRVPVVEWLQKETK